MVAAIRATIAGFMVIGDTDAYSLMCSVTAASPVINAIESMQ